MKEKVAILMIVFGCQLVVAQEADTTVVNIITTESQSHIFNMDSLGKDENYSLDIGKDRGLFILTPDKKMQLRLLGSIRFLVLYDFINFPRKTSFNPYYIPLESDRVSVPNYYGNLNQSRFGFEITRLLNNESSVFIRLEMDFSGPGGSFRFRHAYGQLDRFLVGQTWSLFSNVTAIPSMVNFDGPAGSVTLRTPQMRYFGSNRRGTRWAFALEYSRPDLNVERLEEYGLSALQIIPDFTARIEREGVLGAVQLSGVLTTLSVIDDEKRVSNSLGYGASLSGTVDLKKQRQVLYQLTYGKAISHFMTTFDGTGSDAVYNPINGEVEPQVSFGGFLAYDFHWRKTLNTNLAIGYAALDTKDFQPDTDFKRAMSISADAFWQLAEGTKLGVEYIYGRLWSKGAGVSGASRIGALFYYDF